MFDPPDYTIVDREGLVPSMFHPRRVWQPPPRVAFDFLVPVEGEIGVACRFYPCGVKAPTILYFHGNGEVVSEYDSLAPLYITAGINLFVADYRGYGASGGHPTFSGMLADAHKVAVAFHSILNQGGFTPRRFLMGRSLGAHSAIELAAHYPDRFHGLITESGTASVTRFVHALANLGKTDLAEELEQRHLAKLHAITIPALIIHGTRDELVSIEQAYALFEHLTMPDKRLVTIEGGGHNDILFAGLAEYFTALREFVRP